MEINLLRYVIQKIDGSTESILDAIKAILGYLHDHDGDMPKSVEHAFFEESMKSVFDWISKGDQETLRAVSSELNKMLATHDELTYPMAGLTARKRVGIQLNFLIEMMNVYLRSDLELKDTQHIMLGDKVQKRLRALLAFLYEKASPFRWQDIIQSGIYTHTNVYSQKKAIIRDLEDHLVKYNFVQKNLFGRKNLYDLTPRAFFYKDRILEMQKGETTSLKTLEGYIEGIRRAKEAAYEEFIPFQHMHQGIQVRAGRIPGELAGNKAIIYGTRKMMTDVIYPLEGRSVKATLKSLEKPVIGHRIYGHNLIEGDDTIQPGKLAAAWEDIAGSM